MTNLLYKIDELNDAAKANAVAGWTEIGKPEMWDDYASWYYEDGTLFTDEKAPLAAIIPNHMDKAQELWALMDKHGPSSDGCYFDFTFKDETEEAAVGAEAERMEELTDFFELEGWSCDAEHYSEDEDEPYDPESVCDYPMFFNFYIEDSEREDEFHETMSKKAA